MMAVSIPQWCDCCPTKYMSQSETTMFQSHNGAIAAHRIPTIVDAYDVVSIPQWCDCCHRATSLDDDDVVVSIPQWCDCCKVWVNGSQFHDEVSIPQWCDCCQLFALVSQDPLLSFNPTMVRLLQELKECLEHHQKQFQSHNGAIAA